MSKKTLLELQDERVQLTQKADQLVQLVKTENRRMTKEEQESFAVMTTEISNLNNEIQVAEVRRENTPLIKVGETRELIVPAFSLLKAIESRANGIALGEQEQKIIAAGRAEMRKAGLSASGDIILPLEYRAGITAGTATSGQEIVNEQKMSILEPLREALVLTQAGANWMSGLVGDVSIPTYTGTTALWKAETAIAVDGAGTTAEVILQPKRLTAFIDISKQFLLQDSVGAEALLMSDIVRAVAIKLEQTVFGSAAGSSTQPAGLFAAAPSVNGVATWANMVALETAVDTGNALVGNLKYITHASGRGILKNTVKVTAQPVYLLGENGQMNGYPVLVSNVVATGLQAGVNEYGIVFGNWADFIVGQWGSFDLTIDNISQAVNGNVRVIINAYFDAKVRRAASFKTGSIK